MRNQINALYFTGQQESEETSTALEFAWKMKEKDWTCLWFNSERFDKFMINLETLTDIISETNRENKTFEYRTQKIKSEFERCSETKFLIILDNLNEFDWIERIFTNLSKNVSIIATLTKRNVLNKIAYELKINYFNEEQPNLLLKKNSTKRETSQDKNLKYLL